MQTRDGTPPPASQGLADRAAAVRAKHAAVEQAIGNVLSLGMDAGDELLAARQEVPAGSWQVWVRQHCGLSERTARVYLQLARARPLLERQSSAGPMSIAAALRFLQDAGDQAGPERKSEKRKRAAPPALSPLAWLSASNEERRRFLDGIGLMSLLAAIPSEWRIEIERRAGRQHARGASKLSDTLTKALRTALSLQVNAPKDGIAHGVANSINAILNKLAHEGLDLHDVEIVIATTAAKRAA